LRRQRRSITQNPRCAVIARRRDPRCAAAASRFQRRASAPRRQRRDGTHHLRLACPRYS